MATSLVLQKLSTMDVVFGLGH